MNWLRMIAVCLLWLSWPVHAHKASDSYLVLDVQGAQVVGQWDIALRDIDFALGLDADGDGSITWGGNTYTGRNKCSFAWMLFYPL